MTVAYSSKNTVVNGDAETGPVATNFSSNIAPFGWTVAGTFTGVTYAAGGGSDLNPADALDSQGGSAYFAGGTTTGTSTASQRIDVSAYSARIDAGKIGLDLSGQLGGYAGQDDRAVVTAQFIAADGVTVLGTLALTGPLAAGRGGLSTLVDMETASFLTAGTRFVEIVVTMARSAGTYNDGYADNISAHLTGLVRGQVQVMGSQDFTTEVVARSTGVSFTGLGDATALFRSDQFGTTGLAFAGEIEGSTHDDTLAIQLTPATVFNAGNLRFTNWTAGADLVSFTGTAQAERLTGSVRDDVIDMGDGVDTVAGGAGNDTIDGGAGRDRLGGGFGADQFVLAAKGVDRDTIADFDAASDGFIVEVAKFPTAAGLVAGTSLGSAFLAHAADAALGAEDRFIYNTSNGKLWFDADGTGVKAGVLIAVLTGAPVVSESDFLLV